MSGYYSAALRFAKVRKIKCFWSNLAIEMYKIWIPYGKKEKKKAFTFYNNRENGIRVRVLARIQRNAFENDVEVKCLFVYGYYELCIRCANHLKWFFELKLNFSFFCPLHICVGWCGFHENFMDWCRFCSCLTWENAFHLWDIARCTMRKLCRPKTADLNMFTYLLL